MKIFEGIVFGIDFDGTCVTHCFPEVGKDCPGAITVLNWIVENGGKLVLNTMRSNNKDRGYLNEAVRWFFDKEIILYGVNKNPSQVTWTSSPKVYAHVYIDDAALGCPLIYDESICHQPFVDWDQVYKMLKKSSLKEHPIINGGHVITE